MKNTCWIVELEPIDARYTKQWYTEIPNQLEYYKSLVGSDMNIATVGTNGIEGNNKVSTGAFLDFFHTNAYKSSQIERIAKLFQEGYIKAGDRFLVTDLWHFGITALRYMSELAGIKIEIYSICHAGAYDPSDILGMKMGKDWSHNQERAWFYACDAVFVASNFNRNLFLKNLDIPAEHHHRVVTVGLPMNYLENLRYRKSMPKENIVLFTHRLNEDKIPEIFRDIRAHLPADIKAVMTQEENLNKEDYYDLLGKSKVTFSCSLHENFGIGMMESVLCGAIPLVPNRACYPEFHLPQNVYPSEWTSSFEAYLPNRYKLIDIIVDYVRNYDVHMEDYDQRFDIIKHAINPEEMYNRLVG